MRPASADFLRSFLCVSGVLLAGIVLLNRAVDPYGAYRGFPSDLFLEAKGVQDTRTWKAELVRHFTGSTVLVGSSRVRTGYDPESTAIPDRPACNLGIGGTNFYELAYVLDFILQQPRVRRIVLCLDFQQFTAGRTVSNDFDVSRFNPGQPPFDYHCNLLLRQEAARISLETLARHVTGTASDLTPLGFHRPEAVEDDAPAAKLAERSLRSALNNPDTLAGFRYSQERLSDLARAVRDCRTKRVELIVVIHPVHATMLESVRGAGLWDEYEQWVRDVARIVAEASDGATPVWDFTGYGPYTDEPLLTSTAEDLHSNRWFWEPSHCKAELGEQVLRRIFDSPHADPGFGRRITPDNAERHLAQILFEREAWARTNGDEAAAVEAIARAAGYEPNVTVVAGAERGPTY
jgi:hypothetical protein